MKKQFIKLILKPCSSILLFSQVGLALAQTVETTTVTTQTTPQVYSSATTTSGSLVAAGRGYAGFAYSMSIPTSDKIKLVEGSDSLSVTSRLLKTGHGVNLNAAYFVIDGLAIEGFYNYNNYKHKKNVNILGTATSNSGGSSSMNTFGLLGKYYLDLSNDFYPYAGLGIGYGKLTDMRGKVLPIFATGAMYKVSDQMSVGLDVNYMPFKPRVDRSDKEVKYDMGPLNLNFGVKYHF